MMDAELPTHLLYALTFGAVVLGAITVIIVETGVRTGKRRISIMAWSALTILIGGVFLVINVANVITETANPGAG